MDALIVVGILVQDEKVLVVRRRAPEGPLEWQFPGGAVEAGETEIEAVEREVCEEVGIDCRAEHKLGERVHPNTGRTVSYWCCRPLSGTGDVVAEDELRDSRWATPSEVLDLITTDLFLPVREYLERVAHDEGARR